VDYCDVCDMWCVEMIYICDICAVIYICAVKCNAKTKKIHISEALPSVMTKTLGKANIIS